MRGLISEPAFAVSPCSWEQYSQRKGVRQEEIYNLDRFSRNYENGVNGFLAHTRFPAKEQTKSTASCVIRSVDSRPRGLCSGIIKPASSAAAVTLLPGEGRKSPDARADQPADLMSIALRVEAFRRIRAPNPRSAKLASTKVLGSGTDAPNTTLSINRICPRFEILGLHLELSAGDG
jgi:hypothetical protein